MKTLIGEAPPVFKPVHIVLETPEEVAKFHALFNYCPVIEGLEITAMARASRDVIETQGYPHGQQVWFEKLQASCERRRKY